MMNEDITFCDANCKNMKCERNKRHIRLFWMPHSFANLKGDKDYCLKAWRNVKDEKKKNDRKMG